MENLLCEWKADLSTHACTGVSSQQAQQLVLLARLPLLQCGGLGTRHASAREHPKCAVRMQVREVLEDLWGERGVVLLS